MARKYSRKQRHRSIGERLRNHPYIVPVSALVVFFFASMILFVTLNGSTVGASDSRVVQLSIDGARQVIPTRASDVGDLLERLEVELHEKDVVEPALDTPILEDNFKINVYRAKPVTIVDGGRKVTTMSAEVLPNSIAAQAGLTIYPEDTVSIAPSDDAIKNGVLGDMVVVDRAIPANINLYGTPIAVRTHAKTVRAALQEKSIQTVEGDTVAPGLDAPLSENLQIIIVRVGKQIATIEEEIPAPVETIKDPEAPQGVTKVKEPGSPGKKVVTYEIELQNDKEVSRKPLQEVIAVQPVKRVVTQGTKLLLSSDKLGWLKSSNIPAADYTYVDYIIAHESTWRPAATNSLGCIGLGQSCPQGGVAALATVCPNWQIDPVCQLNFFHNYAVRRYGSWGGAYNFWLSKKWW